MILIFIFIFIFILSFLFHELMHGLEGYRQGGKEANIQVSFFPPTMYTTVRSSIKNYEFFKLAGGFYTGIVFLIISILTTDINFHFSLITMSAMNFYYSLFEMKYLGNIDYRLYRIGRYSIYGSVIFAMVILYKYLGLI